MKLTTEKKVCKRFFDEEIQDFEEENYLLEKLGYDVQWMREMDP